MRRAWLITLGAAFCATTTATGPVAASPADVSFRARPVAAMDTADSWTDKLKFWKKEEPSSSAPWQAFRSPNAETTEISPWRHPFTYLSTEIAESRIAAAFRQDKAELDLAGPADKISLNTPTAPATPQFYVAVSLLSERQNNVQQARQQLQQGLAKWPRDVNLLRAAARLEDRQGNLPLAEILYRRAIATNPQHAGALNDLGLCLARQGKFDESVRAIEQAINLQPEKALYRNNVATVLVEMHEDQRALAHLSAVHSPAESNYNLGQLLVARGRPHEAAMYYQTALDIDPTMEPARLAISQLHGTLTDAAQVVAEGPTMQPQEVTPTYGPRYSPEPAPTEPSFPETARGPAFGTSSYVPPSRYYPANNSAQAYQVPARQAPVYQTATAPRYLPPVRSTAPGAAQGGATVR